MWGRIQEHTRTFEYLVHETWPRTYGRIIFKFYKKQTKSENHEICQDVTISYVEAVVKIEKVSHKLSPMIHLKRSISEENHIVEKDPVRFEVSYVTTCVKPSQFFYHSLHVW
jgi:hypothetical protein